VTARWAPGLLLALGLLQMAGSLLQVGALRGLGLATAASPAPRVFSTVGGLEAYSTRFFVEWHDQDGRGHSLHVTPDVYQRLAGPYNRRNAYGAALAAGPVLASDPTTARLFQAVTSYALCGGAPVLRELKIDGETHSGPPRLRYEPITASSMDPRLPRVLSPRCR
jgi:hypothetical protein